MNELQTVLRVTLHQKSQLQTLRCCVIHLYAILEMTKLWQWRAGEWCQGIKGGQEWEGSRCGYKEDTPGTPDTGWPDSQLSQFGLWFPVTRPPGQLCKGHVGSLWSLLTVASECLKTQSLMFKNGPKIRIDISPKKIRNWPTST